MVTGNNIQQLNKVILPIIRRVLPNAIAQSIVGVQPMTGPTGMIYTMRARYGKYLNKIRLDKQHYRKFLRLYDRRQFTYHQDILDAGYSFCEVAYDPDIVPWCNEQFGKCGYIYDVVYIRFYFENINDQTLFKMRWL